MSKFLKILTVVLITLTLLTLLGRNHFILGTILGVLRWVYFGLSVVLLIWHYRRGSSKHFKIALSVVLLFVMVEWSWIALNHQKLKNGNFSQELSVMSYNLYFRNQYPLQSISNIVANKPDVLALQELTPNWKQQLDKALGSTYPYKKCIAINGTHGIGVYSKYPISDYQILKNPGTKPFAQSMTINVKGTSIQFINIHLASPAVALENPDNFISLLKSNYELRQWQMSEVKEHIAEEKRNFKTRLLVGDLNTTQYEPLFREILYDWVNLFDESGKGGEFTFPNSGHYMPFLTLDYILLQGQVEGIDMEVIAGGSSDHLALLGKVQF